MNLPADTQAKLQTRQKFRSQYGRRGISVSAGCPTRAITHRLGRTHVATSDDDIAQMIRDALDSYGREADARWTPALEREAIRFALWRHAENRAEYAWVMGSH